MLPKGPYNPIEEESKILKFWLDNKFFKPEYHPLKGLETTVEMKMDQREPFCIIDPPPNVNGRPHIGNASGYSYQDLIGRFNRMKGKKTLLLPGKDHAGIESEIVFERNVLKPKRLTKIDLGRDEFYKQCNAYCMEQKQKSAEDEARIGLSADFERDTFTLDPEIVKLVLDTFIKLYNDGYIYKGVRIINWCPDCQTALADIDCERLEREANLYYIKYPIKGEKEKFIEVATTRPETMLGDTAVAVNPKDKRYKSLIGGKAILPLVEREIPIIIDPMVDIKFGTGAVKVTPAHSPEDYETMLRHNKTNPNDKIDYINVIWKNKKMVGPIGKYKGMKSEECREAILEDLKELKLFMKQEKIQQNIAICERSKTIIEPLMSSQWYVKVDTLKKPAIKAVEEGEIKIHPGYMTKKYMQWMEELRDWPISRSLWWGYRIPAWYKGEITEHVDENGKIIQKIGDQNFNPKSKNQIKIQLESPGKEWTQDNDVLDTWFSSGQWGYAPLMKCDLLDTFYPTDVMETMHDILEKWVSRMVMLGIYRVGKIPFKDVYLHGMVLGADGQKMSKSRGNVVMPDDVISKNGADTLRLFYYIGNKAGAQYRVDYEKIKGNRNFLNKIWNASKFVLFNIEDLTKEIAVLEEAELALNDDDNKMLKELQIRVKETTKKLEEFKLGLVSQELYESFWHIFCDWYIEAVKPRLFTKDREGNPINQSEKEKGSRKGAQWTLWRVLKTYIELLHPFIPFITERIWQELPKEKEAPKSIMYQSWPE